MIEIAVGKHFRENHEDKHKRDAKNGWYRYDSRFAFPVYDVKGIFALFQTWSKIGTVLNRNSTMFSSHSVAEGRL